VLKIERTAFDASGRAVEFMIGFYPPDRYQYEVTMPRQRPSQTAHPTGKTSRGKSESEID
jgi:hypothetical protein